MYTSDMNNLKTFHTKSYEIGKDHEKYSKSIEEIFGIFSLNKAPILDKKNVNERIINFYRNTLLRKNDI